MVLFVRRNSSAAFLNADKIPTISNLGHRSAYARPSGLFTQVGNEVPAQRAERVVVYSGGSLRASNGDIPSMNGGGFEVLDLVRPVRTSRATGREGPHARVRSRRGCG